MKTPISVLGLLAARLPHRTDLYTTWPWATVTGSSSKTG